MKSFLRTILKLILRLYPIERGKYTILTKYYFPKLTPPKGTRKISRLRNKIKMDLDLNEFLQSYLYLFGSYELPTIRFIKKTLKKGDIVIDIGANVGYLSLTFAQIIGDLGKVYGFEPEKRNFEIFNENIKLNGFKNIHPYKLAVSDNNKIIKLYLSKNENQGIHSTLLHTDTLSENFEEIEAIILDDFVIQNKIYKIDLVKIDVEGAEIDVVNGMKNILRDKKPVLILELVSELQKLKNMTTSDFKKMMHNEFNYSSYIINEKGFLNKVSIDIEHISDNVVFIHNDSLNYYNEIIM
ncbi:MAG: hypothetical protein A2X61_10850 [Ignavibacteria bacterium GWB2_35_12]|nr:MAG: hypothetical protein A2X61_10850 [Ignavibacteria bacterium GWB2_35_12]OGU93044.1 MAG: hypothetical protein A2220_15970 [Ignavibacteria bacterium RIFOXYA2_FULL_35_10]OGV24736.1 MAG: hypothetical protein A2475_14075 [Ignavibacteria bacterium RIFOXYC2_FULL_35_21]